MSAVSFSNSNNYLGVDSFNQNNSVTGQVTSSAPTEQSKKTETAAQRAVNLTKQAVMAPVNFGINLLKGAAISTGVEGITSRGKSFEILYKAFFSPACLDNFAGIDRLSAGRAMAKTIVIDAPIMQELVFRGLLQDIILKRAVKNTVELVLPKHSEFIDSQYYTAFRILVASALFSYVQSEYFAGKVIQNFFNGVVFGLLKEKYGLASAIGAHMLHAFIPMAPDLFSSC